MNINKKITFATLLTLLFSFSSHAQRVTVGQEYIIENGINGSIQTVDLENHTSYSCQGIPLNEDNPHYSIVDLQTDGFSVPYTDTTAMEPVITQGINIQFEGLQPLTNRISFITQASGYYRIDARYSRTGAFVVAHNVSFKCEKTSLYGGYNTFVNDFNFLEVTNVSNSRIEAEYIIYDNSGSILEREQFSVSPSARVDFDIHSTVGANKFGMVKVNSIAPRGSLRAFISQYKTIPGTAEFELKDTTKLETR